MGICSIMMPTDSHIILIDSVEPDSPRRLVHGILTGPQRFVDFPGGSWEGWILGGIPQLVTVKLTTVESLVTYIPGAHPDGSSEVRDARQRLRMCLAGVQNRLPLTIEAGPTHIAIPSFLATDATMRPSTYEAEVELLLGNYAESADFQAWVSFNRWMDRMMNTDPDIGNSFVGSRCSERLVSAGRSMSIASGLLLPFEVAVVDRLVYGVLRLDEARGPNLFSSTLFMSDRCDRLQPGTLLRRAIRFEEEGKTCEFHSEIARISSLT